MSDDGKPKPIPHIRLYVGAAVLFGAAVAGIVLTATEPTFRGMPAIAAAAMVLSAQVVIGTAAMKRHERCDERTLARLDRIEQTQERILARLECIAGEARERAQASFASGYLEGVQAHRRAANGTPTPHLYAVRNGD